MSAKTKIVVLHMKELIYTAIFAALGILFIVLLIMMFLPDKEKEPDSSAPDSPTSSEDGSAAAGSDSITSIRMVNLNDAITTMYPLLEPTFEAICSQVYQLQTLEGVTYSSDSKYTSLVLLETIQSSLDKASVSQ